MLQNRQNFPLVPTNAANRFGSLKTFYKAFNGQKKKTPEKISRMLLENGFHFVKDDVFINEAGVKIHIDPHCHNKHLDVHVPGRPKIRVSYFA